MSKNRVMVCACYLYNTIPTRHVHLNQNTRTYKLNCIADNTKLTMATTSTISSLLLLTSLLHALSTTKTVATFVNPISIPSCTGHPSLLQCAHDIQFALLGSGYAEIGSGVHIISLIQDSINAAKASYINVLHFLSSSHIDSGFGNSLQSAFQIAIDELNAASKVSFLSSSS
jgi:hypothetical protein